MPLRTIVRVTLLCLGGLAMQACFDPQNVQLAQSGYNQRLRPDREPLTTDQAATDPQLLRFGAYRDGPGELQRALMPALAGPVQNLPQSDCYWLARTPDDLGDAMRAQWEAVADLDSADFEDPEDGRKELGLCRLNDPETRRPLLAVDRSSNVSKEITLDANGDPQRLLRASFAAGDNMPILLNDQFALLETLTALSSTANDPFNSCAARLASFNQERARIARGTDFFDGPSDGGFVPSCTRPDGFTLLPAQATRYRLRNGEQGPEQLLEPALLTARRNDTLARPLLPDANGAAWRTAIGSRDGNVRWEENFSPNLRVASVRLFGISSGQRRYLETVPPLCLVDADSGMGCRWRCEDSDPSPTVARYDLLAAGTCTDAQARPATPEVTPTYSALTWNARPLLEPLHWRFEFRPTEPVWVEFTLATTLAGMALTAEPAGMDLGRVPPGERRPGLFTITNLGEHAVRITRARIDPSWRQASAFTLRLPFAPEPLPLPIALSESGPKSYKVSVEPAFEAMGLVALFQGPSHWHVRPAQDPRTPILYSGIAIGDIDGVLWRDRAEQRIAYQPPDPQTRAPIRAAVYAPRRLPFVIQPGERFDLQVTAAPGAIGRNDARVEVTGESVLDSRQRQSVSTTVTAYGLVGPQPLVVPAHRHFDARTSPPVPASFLVINNGDMPLTASSMSFTAEDGGVLAPANDRFRLAGAPAVPFAVASGASRVVSIGYDPRCGAGAEVEHRAALRIASAAGSSAVLLVGRSPRCPP